MHEIKTMPLNDSLHPSRYNRNILFSFVRVPSSQPYLVVACHAVAFHMRFRDNFNT